MTQIKTNKFEDEFTLHEKLGEGAFAQVYRATHITTHKDYAVKLIVKNIKLPGGKRNETCSDSELKITKKLYHENIVNLVFCYEAPSMILGDKGDLSLYFRLRVSA